jgi:glycosyltransferase involved in cell wall biosynthesis
MKTKLLYLDLSEKFGGALISLLSRLEHLDPRRYQPYVICRAGPQADALREMGVFAKSVNIPSLPDTSSFRFRFGKLYNPMLLPRHAYLLGHVVAVIARLHRKHRFDILHGSTLFPNLYVLLAGELLNTTVIWHINDFAPRRNRSVFHLLSKRASRIIAISRSIQRSLENIGVNPEKIVQIYQPIDGDRFKPRERDGIRDRLNLPRDSRVLGYAGRLEPAKGISDLLRAAKRIRAERPDVRFILAGAPTTPAYQRSLERETRALEIEDCIHFLGPRDDIHEVFNAMDVLLFPSRHEGFGRVVAEAMASGVPAVVARAGGTEEIVSDGETGYVLEDGDPERLARTALRLLKDERMALEMGRKARERVLNLFSPDSHVRALDALYRSALEERRSR